ncbi:hypothetical protein [Hymenobacter sp. DG01]|uniref:GapS4a family protein n=1 Tax=Hymenobacter sp. DG01 TaxID=2584940 RepID=UPI0011208A20|nr:hypothetical protein [Hymenobacter sp. DG01]
MGEKSKTLGELGENKVKYLMDLVGWSPNTKNLSIPCIASEEHKENIEPRRTHGIDALYRYECPLVENSLAFVVVSSKNQGDYNAKPTIAKKYFVELANTINCFKESEIRKDISKLYKLNRKYIGIVFWLSEGDDEIDLINKFSEENLLPGVKNTFHAIVLIDNLKANFLFDSVNYVKDNYINTEFYYHNTGYNSSPTNRITSGHILPAEVINSGLLTFKASEGDIDCLIVVSIERYSEEGFKRLISLCQNITDNWVEKVVILFGEYNNTDSSSVDKVKLSVKDDKFTRKIDVNSFKQSLRNVNI